MSGMIRLGVLVIASALLFGCGGGGGDSGGETRMDTVSASGDFTLSTQSVSFTAATSSSSVPSQRVSLTKLGSGVASFTITTPSGTAQPSWLNISISLAGAYADLSVTPAGLADGTHTATLRVTTADSAGKTLVSKDVAVVLKIGSTTLN